MVCLITVGSRLDTLALICYNALMLDNQIIKVERNKESIKMKSSNNTINAKSRVERLQGWATPKIDWLAKMAAAGFFIATSYGYVHQWAKVHQVNTDLSVAFGIMMVTIALYLFVRVR